VQTRYYNSSGANYQPAYPASIVADPQKGYAARFEVRSGDVPSFGGGERAEVQASESQTGGTEGQARWYQFSTRFDPSFPQNHRDLGWGVTNQWHADTSAGAPPLGWYVDRQNGFWSLVANRQSSPGAYLPTASICNVPLGTGWHDVKMQVNWSVSDSTGWVRLWLNGVRQTFANGADTYYVRTLIPGSTTVYYKEGYYRQAMRPTGIVYHAGFRTATEEGGLN
jgi:polysaccharide lyase-like protein